MNQASVVIHKGRREEKYEICVEDYVLSYLKEEAKTLEMTEFSFYGSREEHNRRYLIYGAGRGRDLAAFDQYVLLDEIGCRLTQAGPIFFVREGNGTYEVKGYDVFYQDNKEMQDYLIGRRKRAAGAGHRPDKTPHGSMISVQLCVILAALVAIVINSANSYDKMIQLNQSAEEVFFAMENQEAQNVPAADETAGDVEVVREDMRAEEDLKLVALENEDRREPDDSVPAGQEDAAEETDPGTDAAVEEDADGNGEDAESDTEADAVADGDADGSREDTSEEADPGTDTGTAEEAAGTPEEYDEVEAFSRNVARYYEVERGDTLYTISRAVYGDTDHVKDICELNEISDPDRIRYGQKIRLP